MSEMKRLAADICGRLCTEGKMDWTDYSNVFDAIYEIDTLEERDAELEDLWERLADVPVDPKTEQLEASYLHFPAGTGKMDIWAWFDRRYSKGVAHLLYRDGGDNTVKASELLFRSQLCTECDSGGCIFNPEGICMAPFLTGSAPRLHNDGCYDFCHKNGG